MNLTFPIADWLFGTSDLDRGLIGTLFNGYDTRYLKGTLRGHPHRPDEAAAGRGRLLNDELRLPWGRLRNEDPMPNDVKADRLRRRADCRSDPRLLGRIADPPRISLRRGHRGLHGGRHVDFSRGGSQEGRYEKGETSSIARSDLSVPMRPISELGSNWHERPQKALFCAIVGLPSSSGQGCNGDSRDYWRAGRARRASARSWHAVSDPQEPHRLPANKPEAKRGRPSPARHFLHQHIHRTI